MGGFEIFCMITVAASLAMGFVLGVVFEKSNGRRR